ncbi:MAG: iron uptake porin [Microcystaceae cyanobacterium]
MSNSFWNLLKAVPATVGISLLASQGAIAAPTAEESFSADKTLLLAQATPGVEFISTADQDPMSQVTSVSELRDVEPTEWAYEALRSLVERYGCIVGYPDRTFRGNRALTRWEFAAGLNACMNVMERLIQENVAVLQEDVDRLRRLAEEFQAELVALGARVDNLESRVSFLEDNQFSTTTKLNATVIMAVTDASGAFALDSSEWDQVDNFGATAEDFGGDRDRTLKTADQTTLSNRVRLNFDTSFTGQDRLRTRIQAANTPNYNSTGTDMARLGHDGGSGNDASVIDLYYRFKVSNFTGYVGTVGLDIDDIFEVANPYMASSDTGALSRFSRRNPLVFRGPEGAGAGFKYGLGNFYLGALYLAGDGANPSEGSGVFNGEFSGGAQIGYENDSLNINFVYLHSYYTDANYTGSTGSRRLGSNPWRAYGSSRGVRDSYGVQASWQVFDGLNLSGWGGYGLATAQDIRQEGTGNRVGADYWTWNVGASFLDIFKEGAIFNLNGGLLPRAGRVDQVAVGDFVAQDQNASYIVEAAYKYPVTKNILITPGAYVILNPDHNSRNPSIWVGVLRTTFKF